MSRLVKAGLALGLSVASATSMAHVGHDHSSWESPLMHALFYGSIAFAGAAAVYFSLKKKAAKQEQQGDKE
ncbi:hypothetical protein A3759_10140 [Thalassolituus sp. HI0120]|jgi:hypothetical protein|nr:hypothetical protein A3759_21610 [Thalassolituus sp. HI0120]KZZ45162.1 hypothetical protein A3759_10140 [Thalassolituus sp. HI0120]